MDEETTTAGRAPLDRADVRAALDPHASPVVLASLAEDVPALRPLIAANPACPAHVLAWLKEHGEASIDDGLSRNPHAQVLGLTTTRPTADALVHYGSESHCPACGASVGADAWVCGACLEPFGAPAPVVAPVTTPLTAATRTDAVAAIRPPPPPALPMAERPRRGPHAWPFVLLALLVLAAAGWLLVRKRNEAAVVTTTSTAAAAASTTAAATTAAPTTTAAPATTAAPPKPTTTPATTAAPPPTTAAPAPTAPATTAPATTAAPPTTAAPAPTAPAAPAKQAVALAQRLVDAYAKGDWATVRAVNPADPRTDDGLAASYSALDRAFALATQTTPAGPHVYNLRLGLVYQLTDNGASRTRLYCVHWDADIDASQIVRVSGIQLDDRDGKLDPNSLKPELESTCPGLALS